MKKRKATLKEKNLERMIEYYQDRVLDLESDIRRLKNKVRELEERHARMVAEKR